MAVIYLQVSSKRAFFLKEDWIVIPLRILLGASIIDKFEKPKFKKNYNKNKNDSKTRNFNTECRRQKIFNLATNNLENILKIRAGEQIVEILYPEFGIKIYQ